MRSILGFLLSVVVLLSIVFLSPARQATAEDLKPFFVLSVSSYDAVMADLNHIGKLGENPNLSKAVEVLLKNATAGKGLAGIDKKRPWGIVVLPNPDNLETDARTFGFVPITNYDTLLETLESLNITTTDEPDGAKRLESPGVIPPSTFIKKIGTWALVTNNPGHFKNAPADPATLLGEAAKKYDVMASLRVKDIPQPMKDVFINQLETVTQFLAMQEGNEAEIAQVKLFIKQLKKYTNDTDTVTFGLAINGKDGKTYFDMEMTAKPETELADEMAMVKKGPSEFVGFYVPKATISANWVGKMQSAGITSITEMIHTKHTEFLETLKRQDISKERFNRVKELTGDIVDVLTETIEADQADGGAAAWLGADTCTIAAGSWVVDTKKLDTAIRGLAKMMIDESPELKKLIRLDAKTHQGVTLHVIQLPSAALGDQFPWTDLVGENLNVVIGTGPKGAYLAAGRDAMDRLTAAIDASKEAADKNVLPVRGSLATTRLAEFLSVAADGDMEKQQAAMIASVLKQAAGDKDHLLLTTEPIPNGFRQRLEIEQGLLKTLGTMSQILTAMMTLNGID